MSTGTLFAVPDLVDPPEEKPAAIDTPALVVDGDRLVDVWVIAGTPVGEPYPCRCDELSPFGRVQCDTKWCPCFGRADTFGTPDDCCGRRS